MTFCFKYHFSVFLKPSLAIDIVKKPFFFCLTIHWQLLSQVGLWLFLLSTCRCELFYTLPVKPDLTCRDCIFSFSCPSSSIVQYLHLDYTAYPSWTADNPLPQHSIHRTYSTKYHLYEWSHSSGKGPKFPVPPVCLSYCMHLYTSISEVFLSPQFFPV